jgi:hypothetical protein
MAEFQALLANKPCLIPIKLTIQPERLTWADVGHLEFKHSFFQWSIDAWRTDLASNNSLTVVTGANILSSELRILDAVSPFTMIFHMSRCGSTLFAKILAQSGRNLMISEPDPVNGLLRSFCSDGNTELDIGNQMAMVRSLLQSLTRRREMAYERAFIKFSSWNCFFADKLFSAFPKVPRIFIYREPASVLTSLLERPAWFSSQKAKYELRRFLGTNAQCLGDECEREFLVLWLTRLMTFVLTCDFDVFINYKDIRQENLEHILAALNIDCSRVELKEMKDQFKFDAKSSNCSIYNDPERQVASHQQDTISTMALESLYLAFERHPKRLHC